MITKVSYFIDYFKYLKNPISCLLFKSGIKKSVCAKFKNSNQNVKIDDVNLLNNLMSLMPVVCKDVVDDYIQFIKGLFSSKDVITWNGVNVFNFSKELNFDLTPFLEYYMDGHYRLFNINYKNRNVIDVGSYAGDTALFFAKEGATVYGFEPVKENYNYSLKLKELNPELKDKLHFFNLGVSDKPGILPINSMNSTSNFRDQEDSYNVNIVTIDYILKENNIQPDILKIDCEGCEFNIILNTDLSEFKDIIFEHHSILVGKDYQLLVEKLKEQGFNISKKELKSEIFDHTGIIYAYK